MQKRDYLLRLIEETASVIVKAAFMRRAQQLQEAMELLNQAMRQLLGLNAKLVDKLSVKDLLNLLKTGSEAQPDTGKVLALADLMLAQSAAQRDSDQETDARRTIGKALELLLWGRVMESDTSWKPEFDRRLESVIAAPPWMRPTSEGLGLLTFYYEETGRYGKAEDVLFERLEQLRLESRKEAWNLAVDEGRQMYERLKTLTDEQLELGNLSHMEVTDAAQELKDLKF